MMDMVIYMMKHIVQVMRSRAPDTNKSGSLLGNVFYNDGVIVITETGSYATVELVKVLMDLV